MQAAIYGIMKTRGMLVNLTAQQEQAAREKVSKFFGDAHTNDESKLAIEGLRYLRTPSASTIDKFFIGGTAARPISRPRAWQPVERPSCQSLSRSMTRGCRQRRNGQQHHPWRQACTLTGRHAAAIAAT
jgi:hypothetical protein